MGQQMKRGLSLKFGSEHLRLRSLLSSLTPEAGEDCGGPGLPQHRGLGAQRPPNSIRSAPRAERRQKEPRASCPARGCGGPAGGAARGRRAGRVRGGQGPGQGRAGGERGGGPGGTAAGAEPGRSRWPRRRCRAPGPGCSGAGAECAPGRPDMEVVDETEALQRFFEGEGPRGAGGDGDPLALGAPNPVCLGTGTSDCAFATPGPRQNACSVNTHLC